MRLACCTALVLSACYSPRFVGGEPCDLAVDNCPGDLRCVAAAGGGGVCSAEQRGIDAGVDGPSPGATCLGKGLLGNVCVSQAPTAAVTLTSVTINTSGVATGGCTEVHLQAGGPSLCIIAATSIDIPSGAVFRAIAANQSGVTSSNPLVLFATQAITIEGTLDVATHQGDMIGGMPVMGGGARTALGCAAVGADGAQGKPTNSNGESYGGGGGAGGTFSSTGGLGGFGGNNSNVLHGTPVAGSVPNLLVGGCPGGNGGNGDIDMSPGSAPKGSGPGGGGGGAVYLLAGNSITIAGQINASGAGGGGGKNGDNSSAGGGGGGAGGTIGLEAGRITVTGSLFANGGGGGAGGGNDGTGDVGTAGADPTGALTAAMAGVGINGGGNGGIGSVGSTVPAAGQNGSGKFPECAGGGGGGGPGAIRVFGVSPSSIGGAVSPPAR
jgi:hypothetical protein